MHVNRFVLALFCVGLAGPAGAQEQVTEHGDGGGDLRVSAGTEPTGGAATQQADRASPMPAQRYTTLAAADAASAELAPDAEREITRENSRARIGGFLAGLAAYTYDNPTHWSRTVARLQLVGQGELADGVKWKLSGRVDFDPLYLNSGFYPGAVKSDQRLEFFYRENYVDFSAGDWDFRLGAQQIIWGEVIGLFFADVVSARDMREFLLPSFDVIRIPQWAARAEYSVGEAHAEFVWIPVPAFDRIGKPGSEFYPVPLPAPLPPGLETSFRDPQRPDRSLQNSNYGVRANTLVAGWDVAAFYYRSFSTSPTFYRLGDGTSDDLPVFQPRYDRIWQTGATFGKDFGDFVLRGEAVYTHGQNFSVEDATAPEGVAGRQTVDYIVGIEWSLPRDTRINVQGFQRHLFGDVGPTPTTANAGFGASLFLSTKLTSTLEPQLLWIRNFKDNGALIRPRVNWNAAPNVVLAIGADIFSGPTQSVFGRFSNRDRLYGEIRFDF